MSNELTTMNLPMSKYTEDEKAWGDVVTSASFLPYITLYGGNSNAVKEGLIDMAHFGLVRQKDKIEDLGKKFDFLALAWRFKAMEIADGSIISKYNPQDAGFISIKEKSAIKDSGCMFGIEFMFYLPNPPAACFATFFCNSKTSRREAPNIKAFCPKGESPAGPAKGPEWATLGSQFIKAGGYSWHGPSVTACSTEYPAPDFDECVEQATKFANPKESAVEAVAPGEKNTRDR